MKAPKQLSAVMLQLATQPTYQESLDLLLALLKEHKDSDIIMAPEVYLTGYDYDHLEAAAEFSQKALDVLTKQVGSQIVVLTLLLKEGNFFVNQAVVIHGHKVVYRQNKVKLFKLGDEHHYLQAGREEDIVPFEIGGVRYALLICFELRFKHLWKQIEGVDIVLIPAEWGLPRKQHLEILSRALAVMNQCYVLLANSSKSDMARSSAIITPEGDAVQDDTKSVIEENVDFKIIKTMRRYIVME